MKVSSQLTDTEILRELGERLTVVRLERNLTQAALAEKAGASKRTAERLESAEVAAQLSAFVRVCRALDLIDRFDVFIPESTPSPIAQLKLHGRKRQRVSGKKSAPRTPKKWAWSDPS